MPKRIYIRPKGIGTKTGLGIIGKPMKEEELSLLPKIPKQIVIPSKCTKDPEEAMMHREYINDEIYLLRDKPGADAIREMYPRKGNIICVYRFANLINDQSYIGQTVNLWSRQQDHLQKKSLEYGSADLQRAIRKYGIDYFTFEVLLDSRQEPLLKTKEGRLFHEALYVEKFDSFYNGYNTQRTTTDPNERRIILESRRDPSKRDRLNYLSLPYRSL
jgi:hypothetical protein